MMNSSSPQNLSIFISHPSDRLTNCQPDGDGLVAFGFISHLAQRGHTLHVVVESADIQGELPDNIKLYPANVQTSWAPLRRIVYIIRVRQIFNQIQQHHNIDVIHQLNPVVTGLSLSLLGTDLPVILGPIVAFWPNNTRFSFTRAVSEVFKKLARDVLSYLQQQQAAALLVATPAALNRLHKPESIADKVYDLRHGIDADLFSPNSNHSSEEASVPTILFLGRVSAYKGIITLLEAFEQLNATLPSCRLLVAGPWGEDFDEVKQQISSMSCRVQIKLLGSVERADVPKLMHDCTLYCMPSYGEAFGMGALEAMACGKPVVGTDAGGLRYLIPDEGGRKVPPGDAQALADALLEILGSPELQVKMGQYNRSLVEKIYDWERVTEQLESIYYKLKENLSHTQ